MHLDPIFLSRLQFEWVIALHILLRAFTVGLASYVAFAEGMAFFTGREIYAPSTLCAATRWPSAMLDRRCARRRG